MMIGVGLAKSDLASSDTKRHTQFEGQFAKQITSDVYVTLRFAFAGDEELIAAGIRLYLLPSARDESSIWWSLYRYFEPALLYLEVLPGARSARVADSVRSGPDLELALGWIPLQGVDFGVGFRVAGDISYVMSDVRAGGAASVVLQFGR